MATIHLTPDGPKPCSASQRKCKYQHFDSMEEAQQVYESRMEENFGDSATLSKPVDTVVDTPAHDASTLTDIAPQQMWDDMISEKMVSVQTHPSGELKIYNYTKTASYSRTWNAVTLASRGLITDNDGNIVARPFTKFFNYGELTDEEQRDLGKQGKITIYDKLDGSMGISYPDPTTGEMCIATRGSFASEQAEHATQVMKDRYNGTWEPDKDHTYLFEVIYPDNKIVLNYGEMDDVVLIGKVNKKTGVSVPLSEVSEWKGQRAQTFEGDTLDDALAMPPRPNAEGVIMHVHSTDGRVKLKQEDYVKMHAMKYQFTTKKVWRSLKDKTNADLRGSLEEEFIPHYDKAVADIQRQHKSIKDGVESKYQSVMSTLPPQADRKTTFEHLRDNSADKKELSLLLLRLDNKNDQLDDKIYDRLEPRGDESAVIFDN